MYICMIHRWYRKAQHFTSMFSNSPMSCGSSVSGSITPSFSISEKANRWTLTVSSCQYTQTHLLIYCVLHSNLLVMVNLACKGLRRTCSTYFTLLTLRQDRRLGLRRWSCCRGRTTRTATLQVREHSVTTPWDKCENLQAFKCFLIFCVPVFCLRTNIRI